MKLLFESWRKYLVEEEMPDLGQAPEKLTAGNQKRSVPKKHMRTKELERKEIRIPTS